MSYWLTASIYAISQNIQNNTSTVRCDLYLDRDSGSAWSNYDCDGYIRIQDSVSNFTSTYSAANRVLLATRDFTVEHNADGAKVIYYEMYFNPDNAYVGGTLSASGYTGLPTIPRAAPISAVNFSNIYSAFNVTYSSYSSSFNYRLRVSIPSVVALETYSEYASGSNKTFTGERQKYLVEYLLKNNKASADLGFVVETYSGSTKIGESNESVKAFTKPNESILTVFSVSDIDTSVTFYLDKTDYWSYYSYVLQIKYGSLLLYSGAYTTSITISDSNTMNSLYSAMSSVISGTFTATLITKYGSYTIAFNSRTAVGTLVNIDPTLKGTLNYYDWESYVTNVTGNSKIIVQNLSLLTFRFPPVRTQKNAEIISHKVIYNSETINLPYDLSEWPYGVVSKTGAFVATYIVTDTRGRTVSSSVNINVVPYSLPTLSWEYYRANSVGVKSLIGGTYIFVKPVFNVASVPGNAVKSTSLKIDNTVVSNNLVSGVGVNYGGSYAINKSYPLEISVTDKFNNITKLTGVITVSELPLNITKDKTGVAFGTVAIKNQITLGKRTKAINEIFSTGTFNQGSWNIPTQGALTQILDDSRAQHSVIVGTDSNGKRHYGIDFLDDSSNRVMRLYSGTNFIEISETPNYNNSKILTLESAFPVNSIYLTYTNINPSTFLGGAWDLVGSNYYIVGAGSSYSGGAQGGSSITGGTAVSVAQMPSHNHAMEVELTWPSGSNNVIPYHNGSYSQGSLPTTSVGGNQAHTHSLTPNYIALYIWRRVA